MPDRFDDLDNGDELEDFLEEQSEDPEFRFALVDSENRARVLRLLIDARTAAQLSQAAVADRMHTTQSAVSELEGGATDPRFSTLQRFARAVGKRLVATVEPAGSRGGAAPAESVDEARAVSFGDFICIFDSARATGQAAYSILGDWALSIGAKDRYTRGHAREILDGLCRPMSEGMSVGDDVWVIDYKDFARRKDEFEAEVEDSEVLAS